MAPRTAVRTVGGVALAGLLLAATGLEAQTPRPQDRGWLGVSMMQTFECVWSTTDDWKDCDVVMDVTRLAEDGPAVRGGLRIGDRLFAINGEEVTFANRERLIGQIRAGTPVSIDVMREGERHFVHVTPAPYPRNPDAVVYVGSAAAPRVRAPTAEPRVYVVNVTELEPREGNSAIAFTVRDVRDGVEVEPTLLQVSGGQVRVMPLDEGRLVAELPEIRVELIGNLKEEMESTMRRASSAFDAFERVRVNLSESEYRARLARVAQNSLDESRLALTLRRAYGGAEFEPVSWARDGLLVLRVGPRTPADRLGLQEGDLVYRVGDRLTRQMEDLVEGAVGDSVRVYWTRQGREMNGILRLPPKNRP